MTIHDLKSRNEFAKGLAHNNTAECFFSLLKRSIYGTHHQYSKKFTPLYLNERDYVFSTRKSTDVERTVGAVKLSEGKRLMHRKKKGLEVVGFVRNP